MWPAVCGMCRALYLLDPKQDGILGQLVGYTSGGATAKTCHCGGTVKWLTTDEWHDLVMKAPVGFIVE